MHALKIHNAMHYHHYQMLFSHCVSLLRYGICSMQITYYTHTSCYACTYIKYVHMQTKTCTIPYSGYFSGGGVKFSWFSWLRFTPRKFYRRIIRATWPSSFVRSLFIGVLRTTIILIAMSLFRYFKKEKGSPQLPNPYGSLAKVIPSSSIAAANVEVRSVITATTNSRKRAPYGKYTPEQKAVIGKSASENGVVAEQNSYIKNIVGIRVLSSAFKLFANFSSPNLSILVVASYHSINFEEIRHFYFYRMVDSTNFFPRMS